MTPELNTHMVCNVVWDQLGSLTPPELTHYYENDHPGALWWLKCAVPHVCYEWLAYYHKLNTQMPDQILIRPQAWDWHGVRIPNCSSVWMHMNVDVHVFEQHGELHHHMLTHQEGTNQFIVRMQQEISKLPENQAWQDIHEALHLMHTHVSDREARMRRKQFGVIHGKKATGHKRARPNLDPERPG